MPDFDVPAFVRAQQDYDSQLPEDGWTDLPCPDCRHPPHTPFNCQELITRIGVYYGGDADDQPCMCDMEDWCCDAGLRGHSGKHWKEE